MSSVLGRACVVCSFDESVTAFFPAPPSLVRQHPEAATYCGLCGAVYAANGADHLREATRDLTDTYRFNGPAGPVVQIMESSTE